MTTSASPAATRDPATFKLGIAWIALCLAFALHVIDEASTGFLSVYNPTVLALRAKLGFWPHADFLIPGVAHRPHRRRARPIGAVSASI